MFEQVATSHLKGYNCNACGSAITGDKLRSNRDDWVASCSLIHDNKYDYSMVVYSKSKESTLYSLFCENNYFSLSKTKLNQ